MLGIIRSSLVIVGLVGGVPVLVLAIAALLSRPRGNDGVVGAISVVALALIVLGIWGALRPEQAGRAQAAPAASATAPPASAPATATAPPAPPSPPAPPCRPKGTTLQLAAANVTYDVSCLAVAANTPFTVAFRNADAGVSHNFHIFSADPITDPNAKSLFSGQLTTGPSTTDYHVTALPAGTYFFHCDVHPTMHGTFVVS